MVKKVVLALLIIGILIFGIKKVTTNKVVKNDNNNLGEIKSKNSVLTEEEKMKIIDEIKIALENKTDKEVLAVNGEKISEREIAFLDFQLNNSYVSDEKPKDAKTEIIKEYAICQDAKKLNISLTNEEIKKIEDEVKYGEEVKEILDILDISYYEFREVYIQRMTKSQLKTKWTMNIINNIINGEVNFDNELFNQKNKEYGESSDTSIKKQLLSEMLEQYTEYLVEKSSIEYIN